MENYEEALKKIVFLTHKRKMLKTPPTPDDWVKQYDLDAVTLLGLAEMAGQIALDALNAEEKAGE